MEDQYCFNIPLVGLLPDEHQKQPKLTKNACFNKTDEVSCQGRYRLLLFTTYILNRVHL